ncbi:N-acetyltransferase family protein [Tsuneonella sp. HG249]
MILRTATSDDIHALVELGRQSFTSAFGHLYRPEDLAAFLDAFRAPEKLAADIRSDNVVVTVADASGAFLGYSTVYLGRGFDERPPPRPTHPATLSQLYCASEATGRGIGTALLEHALDEARAHGCDAVQLSVYSENFGAQRLYGRYGFAKVADIDFWVGNHRDDEFLYELRL